MLCPLLGEINTEHSHVPASNDTVYHPHLADFIPTFPPASWCSRDGYRARIENLSISKGTLCVGVRFILSPVEHLNVSPPDVHRGDIQHDLAETLSTLICGILRFKRD